MNPELKNYIGIPKKLERETENIFNYKFWSEYDVIFCALDSLEGRQYIDEKCILYERPWINGGMNSLKGKTEIFIPFKTCCLNDINFGGKKKRMMKLHVHLDFFQKNLMNVFYGQKIFFFNILSFIFQI